MSDSALPEHQQPRITNESVLAGDLPAAPRNPYIITLWVLAGLAALTATILYIVGSSSPELSDYLSDISLANVATRNANFIAAANALLGVTGLAVVGALLGGAITWKPRA